MVAAGRYADVAIAESRRPFTVQIAVPGVDHAAKPGGRQPPGATGLLHGQNGHESSSSSPASSAATSTDGFSSSSPHPISCVVACTDSAGLAVVVGSGSKSSSSDAMQIGSPASAGMGAASV